MNEVKSGYAKSCRIQRPAAYYDEDCHVVCCPPDVFEKLLIASGQIKCHNMVESYIETIAKEYTGEIGKKFEELEGKFAADVKTAWRNGYATGKAEAVNGFVERALSNIKRLYIDNADPLFDGVPYVDIILTSFTVVLNVTAEGMRSGGSSCGEALSAEVIGEGEQVD